MDKLFTAIYFNIKKRKFIFSGILLLFLFTCFFFISKINFEEDITKILPKEEQNNQLIKVFNQMDFSDKITVMISSENDSTQQKLPETAEILLDSLAKKPEYYTDIQGKVEEQQMEEIFSFVHENLPLFLDQADYQKIQNQLHEDSIQQRIEKNYKNLISPSGFVTKDFILKDQLGISLNALQKLRDFGVSENFTIKNGFLTTADFSTIVLFITPAKAEMNAAENEDFIQDLNHYKNQIQQTFGSDPKISYFGAAFVSLANANQIKSDIKNTVLIAVVILMLILILFYRRIYIPIILFIPAICGAAFALTFLYFLKDSISAISISVGAILLGVTLDYSLHIITHLRENSSVKNLYKNITKPLLGCSLTTSIAFLCLVFVKSEVLRNLGIFAAISVISSAVFALLIIPHLYQPKPTDKRKFSLIEKLGKHAFEKNKFLIPLISIAIVFGIFTFTKVKFDEDLNSLNYISEELKTTQNQLENLGGLSEKSIYFSVFGNDLDSLLSENTKLEKQLSQLKKSDQIENYTSVGNLVFSTETQQEKIQNWKDFWQKNHIDSILKKVNKTALKLGFTKASLQSLPQQLNKDYTTLTLEDYQKINLPFLKESIIEKDGFITVSTLVQTSEKSSANFVESLEKENILAIDRKHLSEQFLGHLKEDFKSLMNYSLFAVFIVLFIFFKRIELALLSITPIILTGIVTMGFVFLFNLELNIFSLIVTTLIIGVGVDFSIFMTSALQKRYTTGKDELSTYRISIILAVLTTILSVGVLIFAKHPALKSISAIALIGILSAMLITFSFYPLLFKFFIENRPKKGKSPVSLRLALGGILSFGYFFLGCLFASFFSLIYILLPFPSKRKKQIQMQTVYRKFFKSVMFTNYKTYNKIRNPHQENFEKPAIIIANHSSELDTLSMGFLPVPLIYLVNHRVYNSPFFGKAIQFAGYFSTHHSINKNQEKLAKAIKQGSSLVVFPEGTRSETGAISRFHKGAFLLAQQQKIDILPVYIHGNTTLLPKKDFVIYDGTHTLEIGKRISFTEKDKEKTSRAITKSISKKFKNRFQEIRNELEDENYFAQKIRLSFLYKTTEIVKKAKAEFEENKTLYHLLNTEFAENEKIFRYGNDLGIWDLILSLQQPKRKIFSYIENTFNRQIAQQNYLLKIYEIQYLEELRKTNTNVLLITSAIEKPTITKLFENHNFEKIVVLKTVENSEIFKTFNYKIVQQTEDYFTFKKL